MPATPTPPAFTALRWLVISPRREVPIGRARLRLRPASSSSSPPVPLTTATATRTSYSTPVRRHPPRPRRMDQVPRHLLQRGGQGQPRLLAREGGLRRHQGSRHGRRRASRGHKGQEEVRLDRPRLQFDYSHSTGFSKNCIQAEVLHRRRYGAGHRSGRQRSTQERTSSSTDLNTALADVDVIIDETYGARSRHEPSPTKRRFSPTSASPSRKARSSSA